MAGPAATPPAEPGIEPLILGRPTSQELTDQLLSPIWTRKSKGWLVAYGVASLGVLSLLIFATWTVWTGIGL